MGLYRDVTVKPWDTTGLPDGIDPKPTFNVPNEKVALVIFAVCASVLFSLLVVSYFIRMDVGDWVPLATPTGLWVNSAILVLSSVAFQLAVVQSRKTEEIRFLSTTGLLSLVGGLLAIAFILGQYSVWQMLIGQGHYLQINPANAFFYLLTGVHILHLLGGLWVWSKAQLRMLSVGTSGDSRLSLELCAWYWHFLLLIWAGLFFLLAAT
jgi:cytochrome c oxidase subunit III